MNRRFYSTFLRWWDSGIFKVKRWHGRKVEWTILYLWDHTKIKEINISDLTILTSIYVQKKLTKILLSMGAEYF